MRIRRLELRCKSKACLSALQNMFGEGCQQIPPMRLPSAPPLKSRYALRGTQAWWTGQSDATAFTTAPASVPISRHAPKVADGAWHTITLQLMEDGRCRLAIDGQSVAILRNALDMRRPLHLTLYGQSLKITVAVGTLEAWSVAE